MRQFCSSASIWLFFFGITKVLVICPGESMSQSTVCRKEKFQPTESHNFTVMVLFFFIPSSYYWCAAAKGNILHTKKFSLSSCLNLALLVPQFRILQKWKWQGCKTSSHLLSILIQNWKWIKWFWHNPYIMHHQDRGYTLGTIEKSVVIQLSTSR